MALTKKDFKKIKDFHGHLGPYAVTGYLIGQLARKYFKELEKITYQGPLQPPYSCLIDGLQLSSGCTVGRGTIALKKAKENKIELCGKNKKITLRLGKDFEKISRKNFGRNMSVFAGKIYPLINQFF